MEFLAGIWGEFTGNIWLYLSMPFISAMVGYGTNVVALKMMFYPMEFIGFMKPIFGWQGIVPKKAGKMAAISVDTITEKLIGQQEMFDRLDPQRVADELEGPMVDLVATITDDVLTEHLGEAWIKAPKMVRHQMISRAQEDAPAIVAEMMAELRQNLENLFDLKEMVITNLVRDKDLLNSMFLRTGAPEFRFIEKSGAYFGFAFGLVQMTLWLFYKGVWVLPFFGLLVGYATNWIALKMIFEPAQPKKYGPVTFQGLFHKRQAEVATDYADLVTDEVVTPANIIEALLKGPYSDKLFAMVQRHIEEAIDQNVGIGKSFVSMTVGTSRYYDMKMRAVDKIIEHMPDTLKHVTTYAEEALDLRTTLRERLKALAPADFEAMLRPAFQEDEWLLIAVGAALGFGVGCFQLFVMFGDQVFGSAEAATEAALNLLRASGVG